VCTIAIAAQSGRGAPADWTTPKTTWGEPDLQGVWTSDDSMDVPYERPKRYGNRKVLTDEEFAQRKEETDLIAKSIRTGVIPNAGYWLLHEGVDAKPYASNWMESPLDPTGMRVDDTNCMSEKTCAKNWQKIQEIADQRDRQGN